jgi:8-oxo-dGTP pyrophosphatase MutT (NUDIX family)
MGVPFNKTTNRPAHIAGAGVLLISRYRGAPCIVIYQMARRTRDAVEICDTLGGHIDGDEQPYEAAARESYEESAATIKIHPGVLRDMDRAGTFVDVPNYDMTRRKFRAYMLVVNNVHEELYKRNVAVFLQNGPKEYAETDELVRFYIADVYLLIKNMGDMLPDTDGRLRRITQRTRSILHKMRDVGML